SARSAGTRRRRRAARAVGVAQPARERERQLLRARRERRVMGAGRPFVWEKSYPAGVRWDAPIATSTIPELLDRAVAQFGDRAAPENRDRPIINRGVAVLA